MQFPLTDCSADCLRAPAENAKTPPPLAIWNEVLGRAVIELIRCFPSGKASQENLVELYTGWFIAILVGPLTNFE